jgi:predicted kinase
MHKPSLTVVTGRAASGKTTLAHALATTIHRPAFCRDEFKEGFVNAANSSHSELVNANADVFEAFFGAIEFVLLRGISLIVEAAFQHELWAPKLERLARISNVTIVICSVDPVIARARFIARGLADPARERFHGDGAVHAAKEGIELPIRDYAPPSLSVPTLVVDTTDGYDPGIEDIASFVSREKSTS